MEAVAIMLHDGAGINEVMDVLRKCPLMCVKNVLEPKALWCLCDSGMSSVGYQDNASIVVNLDNGFFYNRARYG